MRKLLILCLTFYCTLATGQIAFKTGKDGFSNFLKDNTIYPKFSKQNCIQGIVDVRFKLNKKGNVYEAKISKGILGDLDDEALRLVKMSSGKWKIPIGYDTTTSILAPVNFKLSGFGCESKSNQEIQSAIQSYLAEEGLINTIINFYKNIDSAKPGQETQIIGIKKQLGIDDEYLNSRIENGLKKIKQGDQQGACAEFLFVKNMGSGLADQYIDQYCK